MTSGNLTEPGLCRNVEYGVALTDEGIVKQVTSDFQSFASQGAKVPVSQAAALATDMEELKMLHRRVQASVNDHAQRAFEEKLKSTLLRLLRYRARGKTTHAIFSDAIRFLLARGPLPTKGPPSISSVASPGPLR